MFLRITQKLRSAMSSILESTSEASENKFVINILQITIDVLEY